jgi:hypothetical protein
MAKLKSYLVGWMLLSCVFSYGQFQSGMGGARPGGYGSNMMQVHRSQPAIEFRGGELANLKGVTTVNIVYDYAHQMVGKFQNEEDYFAEKGEKEEKFKNPEKLEAFKERWFSARTHSYEPRFEVLFNKYMKKEGLTGINYATSSNITLKVKTLKVEPGFKKFGSSKIADINVECIFLDQNGDVILRYYLDEISVISEDNDPNEAMLTRSYAVAAKMLAKELLKGMKKLKKQEGKEQM